MSAKPNIIFILTDDQGYGDLSRHHNPVLKTPHLDRLCEQSVRFNDFCVSPSCSPTRCGLMTGMHEFKSGVKLDPTHHKRLDGHSLVPLLLSADADWPDRMVFTHMGRWPNGTAAQHQYAQCAVRRGQYQLVRSETCDDPECRGECRVLRRGNAGQKNVAYSQTKGDYHYAGTPRGRWALYDVLADPGQTRNLADGHRNIVDELATAYDQWWDQVVAFVQ